MKRKILMLGFAAVPLLVSGQLPNKTPLLDTGSTRSYFIGEYSGWQVKNLDHVIVIGDFHLEVQEIFKKDPISFTDWSVYVDTNFWYFKMPQGKPLLDTIQKHMADEPVKRYTSIARAIDRHIPQISLYYQLRPKRRANEIHNP